MQDSQEYKDKKAFFENWIVFLLPILIDNAYKSTTLKVLCFQLQVENKNLEKSNKLLDKYPKMD